MTRREPDWADDAARGMTPWPLDMRTMTVTLTAMAVYDFRDAIAAALRAERERCAGIAEDVMSMHERHDRLDHAYTSMTIRDRIRAGDQP